MEFIEKTSELQKLLEQSGKDSFTLDQYLEMNRQNIPLSIQQCDEILTIMRTNRTRSEEISNLVSDILLGYHGTIVEFHNPPDSLENKLLEMWRQNRDKF